jgi:hopene-associated glycosyltransferase HpnB
MTAAMLFAALAPLAAWLVLALARHGFWRTQERDDRDPPTPPETWPSVVAVVPARDEAATIVACLKSLLAQDYPGEFRVVLVDDQSSDATAALALSLNDSRLSVLCGADHPPGWTGKLYALSQGIGAAGAYAAAGRPAYLWLTDADIAHAPDTLKSLAARAEAGGLVLTSLMAKLNCTSFAEKLLIPPFVFFFAMLYPFSAVNDPASRTAAAAGGCMLIRREALERAGGVAAIAGEIIDDCAMGRLLKGQGPIWLGLSERAVSLRPYPKMADIRAMVARSAYAQLRFSPVLLAGTLIGLMLLYLLPAVDLACGGLAALTGALSWGLMCLLVQPMLHFYRRSPFWGLLLPLVGVLYGAFTLDSAVQHWRGRGGMWKGRAQARGQG